MLIIFSVVLLAAISCGLLGGLLLLKQESMLVEAISDAVLPGIVVAFLIAGSLDSPLFLLFAMIFAGIAVFLMRILNTKIRASKESVLGVVFTAFFALGIVLISWFAGDVHLDQDAVIYGSVEFVEFQRFYLNGIDLGPKAMWNLGGVALLTVMFFIMFFKELKVMTFDEEYATALGLPVKFLTTGILFLTTLSSIVAFEIMGSIMVLGLFVIPGAAAYLLTKRLSLMLGLTLLYAAVGAYLGTILAFANDLSVGGSVIGMLGTMLLLTWSFQKLWKKEK